MRKNNNRKINIKQTYWLIPFFLFIFQLILTLNSFNQIRYEELAESVRNPFWIQNRFIYDGISSNIGWYGTLTLIYNIFGFNLFTAKFVRLILHLISLLCLAFLLKKYLGVKNAVIPMIAIGLSPTVLYFNTIQTSYGMDLQYLPIVLYFLLTVDFKKKFYANIKQILGWGIAMIAWMSYPTFIYYLPALFYWHIKGLFGNHKEVSFVLKNLALCLTAFFMPLLLGILFIKNKELLIYDQIVKSGIFRGAGAFGFNLELFAKNFNLTLVNLFSRSFGYNFELNQVEFSLVFPVFAIIMIAFAVFKIWSKSKTLRLPITLALIVLALNILIADFSVDKTPGLRRSTGLLFSIYFLFILSWHWACNFPKKFYIKRSIFILLLLLLPLHHLIVYPINLSHAKDLSFFREPVWSSADSSPLRFLNQLKDHVLKQDLSLSCKDQKGKFLECRYSEVYAAIAGSCLWNKLECHEILGFDKKSKSFVKLAPELWLNYYFGH